MKKLLNKLGLFTETDLTNFGNQMANKKGTENEKKVWHSDVENFKHGLLILIFALASCSNDDQPATTQPQLDCNCGKIIEKQYFGGVSNFSRLTVKNNCTNAITVVSPNGNVGVLNGQWCN